MSFDSLKGQDGNVALLKSILKAGRLPAAFLFWGEEGVGKKLTALNFAKAINCEENKNAPCDKCASCRKIDSNNHPDVHLLPKEEDSTAIKIEDIRTLQKSAGLKSFEAVKKVFILDEAHNLTPEAANAFLKILEEPPQDTLFILVSSKPELLFSTITSRCQKIRFSAMDKRELKSFLKKEHALGADISHYLAYFYQGRLGAALRMKDEAVLKEKNRVIDWLIDERGSSGELDLEDRAALKDSLEVILAWLRDIYLIKTGITHAELINSDRVNDLLKIMPRLSFYDLDTAVQFLSDASLYLEQNVNPKLILANLKVKLWTKLHK
ncbi:MAG: DNA polymerase III subunit delta' [Candidatus Omnitrophica bacterium]|nr:DNA polymerase III subunit delta' [Candidatus Omnitrophota bacterium]MDD5237102.1 DNA polymerase III subunit delta' [Candidatus Omnitrophota bacterium]MDD5611272.1 DNA polymerase III subunit delta' [Candidatus Omnitrophota bacterium]